MALNHLHLASSSLGLGIQYNMMILYYCDDLTALNYSDKTGTFLMCMYLPMKMDIFCSFLSFFVQAHSHILCERL